MHMAGLIANNVLNLLEFRLLQNILCVMYLNGLYYTHPCFLFAWIISVFCLNMLHMNQFPMIPISFMTEMISLLWKWK